MPETNTEPPAEAITKTEREFSPSQSDSERGDTPRARRPGTPDEAGENNSGMGMEWPLPPEVAAKREKLKLVRRLPIVKNPRIIELVTKFADFPWAQDTVMAAHQLDEVLTMYLFRTLEIPGHRLQRWTDAGELVQRALVELAEYETYTTNRPNINLLVEEYKAQA